MRDASSGWIYDGETRKDETRAVAHHESRSSAATISRSPPPPILRALHRTDWTRAIRQLLDVGLVDKEGERRWTRDRLTR